MLMAMDSPQRPRMSFLGYNKIQEAAGRHIEKRNIAITWPLFEIGYCHQIWHAVRHGQFAACRDVTFDL